MWQRLTSKINLTPLSIAIFYACVGGIWLLFVSTKLLTAIFVNRAAFTLLEVNYAIFILVTAWMLYFLIRRSEAGIKQRKEALSRLNRSLKAYSECHQTLNRATEEIQLMEDICRTIVTVGEYQVAWVGFAEYDDGKTVRPVAQWGDDEGYLKSLNLSWANAELGKGPTGTAIRTGEAVVSQYINHDPQWEPWREEALRHGFASSISLPLSGNGRTLGALVIFSAEQCAFDEDEIKLLKELADDLSYGISTLRAAKASRRMEKERQLLASVIQQAKEGILLSDNEGRILYVNPAIERITGWPPSAMVGHIIHTFESRNPNRIFYEAIGNAISSGEGRTGQFLYERRDGAFLEIDASIWPVSDSSGSNLSHVAVIRDITHEIQLERQLRRAQRMEAIGTLAGGIAHDFNNSLASIITCTEMALDEAPVASPLHELLDVILKSGLRGKNLVKQILTFSRQGEQERQKVRVEGVVSECLQLLRASIPASIEIRFHIGNHLGFVMADPTQIHQIVMNLCTNAAHAMREYANGTLEIRIDTVDIDSTAAAQLPALSPGSYLKLAVRDTGHGMDREIMDRIFDPFFTTKGQSEGTGLGLSVVHGIIAHHGGMITVASEPGNGATFNVYLPRQDDPQQTETDEALLAAPAGKERILLIDDDENLVFAAQLMLQKLGYHVTAHSDSRQALEFFKSQPDRFDLVITDQSMPHLNGTDLAFEMTRIRPELPVILCTGYSAALSGATTNNGDKAAGISELALKPLERSEIAATIRRVLDEPRQSGRNHVQNSDYRRRSTDVQVSYPGNHPPGT